MRILHSSPAIKHSALDMRREFNRLISQMPFVLIVRANESVNCVCYNKDLNAGDSRCKLCLGTGKVNVVERHRCATRIGSVPETLPRLIRSLEPAITAIEARFFWFGTEACPAQGDLVVTAEFDRYGAPVIGTMSFYKINHVNPLYDVRGRLVCYKASSELDPVNTTIKDFYVYGSRDTIKYIPVIG